MLKKLAAAALAVSFAGAAMAEEPLTTSKFLTWSADGQKGLIIATAATAAVIAAQNRASQAKCIDAWSAANAPSGYQPVYDAIRRLPNYHPIAIITAVLEKECGAFKYTATASATP